MLTSSDLLKDLVFLSIQLCLLHIIICPPQRRLMLPIGITARISLTVTASCALWLSHGQAIVRQEEKSPSWWRQLTRLIRRPKAEVTEIEESNCISNYINGLN